MNTQSIGSERLGRQTALTAALLMTLVGNAPLRALADHRAPATPVSHVATAPLADLNLSTPAGAHIARKQLNAMAQRRCRDLTRSQDLKSRQASADDGDQTRSMVVEYGDLNLAVDDGASTLYQRLKLAAREVCKTPDGGFGEPAVWLRCYHDALVGAVRDLGNDRVTALYDREHKAQLPSAHGKSAGAAHTAGRLPTF